MKVLYYTLFTLITFFLMSCNNKKNSKIYGTWRSDADTTITYLKEHAVLNEHQEHALPNIFGKVTIIFNPDGTARLKMDAYSFATLDGTEINVDATESDFRYEILGESISQIVIKTHWDNGAYSDLPFGLLKFEDEDTYSTMLSDNITNINSREFFKRVTNTK